LSGNETGSVGGGPVGATGGGRWGITGLTRLFGTEMGTTISWLLPAALILLAAGLAITIRHRRTDRTRAALILWGGWLLVTGLVFSLGKGIIHPYYNVALAPAVGAVVAIGAVTLWRRRDLVASRIVLTGALIATTWWSSDLLARTPTWYPWLRGVSLGVAIATAGIILAVGDLGRVARKAVAGLAIAAALTGTAAFTLATVAQAHTGAIPSVGPAGARQVGGPGARFGGAPPGGLQGLPGFGNRPASPGGQGQGQRLTQGSGQGQNLGGLLNGSTPSAAFTAALKQGAHGFTWVAATVGSNEASGYQLATGDPIMALGGFNGTDPYPTLAEFQSLVAAHKVHYFIPGGGPGGGGPGGGGPGGGGPGGGPQATTATTATNTSAAITSWVESTFTAKTVAGVTVYDLSAS
jgi:4-amino-4-deoxy-L-arabinose transferase-like glycosyltransferase